MTSGESVSDGVSVVVPAYNEEGAVLDGLRETQAILDKLEIETELIVVNDGSTDRTAEIARDAGFRVLDQPENRGYGAALKAGIEAAKFEIIVITDADGTYPAKEIPAMLEHADKYDMVVGARVGGNTAIPLVRRPAKWVLRVLAAYLAGRPIPDLNSGLRVLKRRHVKRFEHLLPSGFSFTTSITLASLCSDLLVHYHPIDYYARVGESKIRATHAIEFLILILRTIVYFNPLKVFLPLGAVFFFGGLAKFGYDLWIGNLSESALLGFLGGTMLWAVGLLSDQIARTGLGGGRKS
ncbi:MAG: glycosyltransferase family 2 protein [Myxococcota bacterium]|nr:glycosyltransferase family 2 protein [Myxococcota bacterium]